MRPPTMEPGKAMVVAKHISSRFRKKQSKVRFPEQRDAFKEARITASDLQRMCRIKYLRARDMRAGVLIIQPFEAERLPKFVQDVLIPVMLQGSRVRKSRRSTALRDRHNGAAQGKLFDHQPAESEA